MVENVKFVKKKLLSRKLGVTETSIVQKLYVKFAIRNYGHPFKLTSVLSDFSDLNLLYRRVNVRGFLHFLHIKLFPFKEQSLYEVTRPQLLHLANFSSFPSLCLIVWFNERKGLPGLFEGNLFHTLKRIMFG